MNLRQIELLRAVVRCETTVRAAQELGLSQPAVSNAIKHLEGQLSAISAPGDARTPLGSARGSGRKGLRSKGLKRLGLDIVAVWDRRIPRERTHAENYTDC